ncbi:MAG: hypothetical protein C0609_08220 [Deltaproteobacteria bacterium]|nr:MAG: hypothetical protein C0609_08220 [Deltaproteobacteria bacterium]
MLARLISLTVAISLGAALPAVADGPMRWIGRAEIAGELTREQAQLMRMRSIFAPEKVPARKVASGEYSSRFCATMMVREAVSMLDSFTDADRAEVLSYIGDRDAPRSAAALANNYQTEHFSFEWGTYGLTEIDGSEAQDLDEDGIPDIIERWASYFEHSYKIFKDTVGFSAAKLTSKIRIVIANTTPEYTLGEGTFGVTYGTLPPMIAVNNHFNFESYNAINDDPEGALIGLMKVTAAHEFFHVFHFIWMPEGWDQESDDWWIEASSVWFEEQPFDYVNDYVNFWFNSDDAWIATGEYKGLPVSRDSSEYYSGVYERGIFPIYIDEHLGGPQHVRAIWELIEGGNPTILGALAEHAATLGFDDITELIRGFFSANATMDYEEGGRFPVAVPDSTIDIATGTAQPGPEYLGARFRRESGDTGQYRVKLAAASPATWGMGLVAKRDNYSIVLGGVEPDGLITVDMDNVRQSDILYGVPIFLDPGGSSSDYTLQETAPWDTKTPPGGVTGATTAPIVEGVQVDWTYPANAVGAVILYNKEGSPFWKSRTILNPIHSAAIRGLMAESLYNFEIIAYDDRGNEATPYAFQATSGVSKPAFDPSPPQSTGGGGGGSTGGGGSSSSSDFLGLGGCFIESLM